MAFIITLIRNFIKNDVIGNAAQTAFYLILSLPPILILLISIGVKFNIAILGSQFVTFILPANIYSILDYIMTNIKPSAQITVLSGVGVVFSASGSVWALMKGVHKAYGADDMKLGIKHRIITAFFTVAFLIALLISLTTLIMSGVWSGILQTLAGVEKGSFGLLSRVLSGSIVYFFVYLLYEYTPGCMLNRKELVWGSAFTAAAWTGVSVFFEAYIVFFTRYTTVYGGIGAFFILIMWMFIISIIILTGAQINVSLAEISKKSNPS